MILLANSTPIVCDDNTLHSSFTNRCSRHDLVVVSQMLPNLKNRGSILPAPTRTQQDDLCKVIIHAPQFLSMSAHIPRQIHSHPRKNKPDSQPFHRTHRSRQTTASVAPSCLFFSVCSSMFLCCAASARSLVVGLGFRVVWT
jgi:hypothetical protein